MPACILLGLQKVKTTNFIAFKNKLVSEIAIAVEKRLDRKWYSLATMLDPRQKCRLFKAGN